MVKINEALLEVRNLYEAMYRFDSLAAAQLGLHVTDLRCANALETSPLSAGEIGSRLALSSGSVTALVNRLVRAEFVERVRDPNDARRSLVALTPIFKKRAYKVYSELGAAISVHYTKYGDDELRTIVDAIALLSASFDDASQQLE